MFYGIIHRYAPLINVFNSPFKEAKTGTGENEVEETSILKSISILVVFSYILFSLVLLLHLPFLNFFAEFVDT